MRARKGIYILIASLCILLLLLALLQRQGKKQTEGFSTYTIPRIIWSYWHDPHIPPKVKEILDERRDILSRWEHRVLNEKTVYDFIPPDEFPKGYTALTHQAKSDWIRLYLLKTYAGCWMDSSIIVNSGEELERLYTESLESKTEFTGFYLSSHTLQSVKETYIESWFILAPLSRPLISLWYEEFTEAVTGGFLPYKKKVFSAIDVSNIYAKDNDDVYLTIHSSLQYVLRYRLPAIPSILIVDASDTMFKPHVDCKWNSDCVIAYVKETPKEKQPPYIKLRGNERQSL